MEIRFKDVYLLSSGLYFNILAVLKIQVWVIHALALKSYYPWAFVGRNDAFLKSHKHLNCVEMVCIDWNLQAKTFCE